MAEQEPVAWLYTGGGHRPEASVRRFNDETRRRFNRTETPLYADPPEIERLRAALTKIAAPRSPCADAWDDVDKFRQIAQSALNSYRGIV